MTSIQHSTVGTQTYAILWIQDRSEMPREVDLFHGFIPPSSEASQNISFENVIADHAVPTRIVHYDVNQSPFFVVLADTHTSGEIEARTLILILIFVFIRFCALNIMSRLCDQVIFRQSPHMTKFDDGRTI
jgi:hypothetical protein